jgi:hypothetical protein
MKSLSSAILIGLLVAATASLVGAQQTPGVQCFVLDIEEPSALYMLGRDVQGEVMVLTEEPLEESPGAKDGARAYLGIDQWRNRPPLRPFSWYWRMTTGDSVRIGFVLPLWGIVWDGIRNEDGLSGTVTYVSDEVGEPSRTSRFSGIRIPCEAEDSESKRSPISYQGELEWPHERQSEVSGILTRR